MVMYSVPSLFAYEPHISAGHESTAARRNLELSHGHCRFRSFSLSAGSPFANRAPPLAQDKLAAHSVKA
jgi:hypothetical protein